MKYLILFFLFLSGATGLVYEIIWTRQLILIFGSTTYTIVAVLSAFMAGLALGSLVFGRIADRFPRPLFLYALLEIGIGTTSLLFQLLIPEIRSLYINQLEIKYLLVFLGIVLPTAFMGGTIPVVVRFLKSQKENSLASLVGTVYGFNTLGAVIGTLLSAGILIELLGLVETIKFTSIVNLLMGLVVLMVGQRLKTKLIYKSKLSIGFSEPVLKIIRDNLEIFLVFGLSGLLAMAYEVLWSRLFTPITGTFIYAFAGVLATYLIGVTIGSFLAKKIVIRFTNVPLLLALCQIFIGLGALWILVIMATVASYQNRYLIPIMVLPATLAMGMTFPIASLVKIKKGSEGGAVGTLYTANTVGSLIGPIFAGFFVIPILGTVHGMLFLVSLNFLLAVWLVRFRLSILLPVLLVAGLFGAVIIRKPFSLQPKAIEDRLDIFQREKYKYEFLEDHTASVLAYNALDKWDNGLLVDGVGMSQLVDETKFMAHLPLLIHPAPKDMLIIAFGMGTTFRSALTYEVKVDAVDLVPSVPKTFGVFYDNANSVLNNPKGNIIINDGRNYVESTKKKYDIIQVDPPPPVNSAGTTILYSKEFYEDSKKILRPGGIFLQWFYEGTMEEDFKILLNTYLREFKYVAAFHSIGHMGFHVLASDEPIVVNAEQIKQRLENPIILADLREWSPWITTDIILGNYYGDKTKLQKFVGETDVVTDNHPITEYFILRYRYKLQKEMDMDNLSK